jgi:hypothetical protein
LLLLCGGVGTLWSLALADLVIHATDMDKWLSWYGLSFYLFCCATMLLLS